MDWAGLFGGCSELHCLLSRAVRSRNVKTCRIILRLFRYCRATELRQPCKLLKTEPEKHAPFPFLKEGGRESQTDRPMVQFSDKKDQPTRKSQTPDPAETDVQTHVLFANFLHRCHRCRQPPERGHAAGYSSASCGPGLQPCSAVRCRACVLVCSGVPVADRPPAGLACDWKGAFASFENRHAATYEPIRGDAVDLPVTAGTCAPGKLIPPALWQEVQDPDNIFPEAAGVVDLASFPPDMPDMQAPPEQARESSRSRLCRFQDDEGTKGRQRKIWDGGFLSEVAIWPPKPARLANPASFLDIVVQPGETLYMSKRDATLTLTFWLRQCSCTSCCLRAA